jgi:hypothetical protein
LNNKKNNKETNQSLYINPNNFFNIYSRFVCKLCQLLDVTEKNINIYIYITEEKTEKEIISFEKEEKKT